MNQADPHETPADDSPDAWAPCPQGTLDQAVAQIKARNRQESLKRTMRVGGGLCAVLLIFVMGGLFLNRGEPNYGGISCSQCASYMEQYQAEELDSVVATRVRTHLESCEACQRHYEKMFGPGNSVREVALVSLSRENLLLRRRLRMLILATSTSTK